MSIALLQSPLVYPSTMQSPYTWEASAALVVSSPSLASRLIATLTGSPPSGIAASIVNVLGTTQATLLLTGVPSGSGSNNWGVTISDPVSLQSDAITGIMTSVLPAPTVPPTLTTLPLAIHTFNDIRWYLSYRTGGAPGSGTWNLAGTVYEGAGASTCTAGALTADLINKRGIVGTIGNTLGNIGFIGNGFPDSIKPITLSGVANSDIQIEDFWDISEGAWWYDASEGGTAGYYLIVAILTSGQNRLAMIKSTDDGTTWTELNRANAPIIPGTNHSRYAVRRDINTTNLVYLFSQKAAFSDTFSFFTFNFVTNIWSAPFGDLDLSAIGASGIHLQPGNGIIPYSATDIGILYGAGSFSGASHVWYRRWSSGSWGSAIQKATGAPGVVEPGNLQYDPANDETYLFWYANSGQNGTAQRVQRDGTNLGSPFVFTTTTVDGLGHGMIFSDAVNGDNIYQPWDNNTLGNAVWVAPRGSVAFQQEVLPVPEGEDPTQPSCVFMVFGEFLLAPPPVAETLAFGLGLSVDFVPPVPASLAFGLGLKVGIGEPNLKLVKVVSNTHGGTALPSDFTLNAAGPTPISGKGVVGPTPVEPGTYVLSESGPGGYTAGQWSCTGATIVGNQVTIKSGETVVCTIVNSDRGGGPNPPTPPTPNPPMEECPPDQITYHASPEGVTSADQVAPTVNAYVSQEPQEPTGP